MLVRARGPEQRSLEMSGEDELKAVIRSGVPEDAFRFFGRWWQLETYLREILYVELRCKYGIAYSEHLPPRVLKLAEDDRINAYMASADSEDLLAYLDAGRLIDLIEKHWPLFAETLLPHGRWEPRVAELRELRNRVSHCRRPHSDDLSRILQLLSDLELGAQRFYASHNAIGCEFSDKDPIAKAWIKGRHRDAHLIDHAKRAYWTRLRIQLSRRPWADESHGEVISGKPGYLWHAHWVMEGRLIRATSLWERISEQPGIGESIVHLLLPNPFQVTATFASIDDPSATADSLGRVFEAVLEESEEIHVDSMDDVDLARDQWRKDAANLQRKVQLESTLALFDPYNPTAVFGV
jgi:hypothetical protein